MTCFEKYISEHTLPIVGCPVDYGYAPKPADCYCLSCFRDCWSREVTTSDKKEEKK